MEQVFQFLFKYRPALFQEGDVALRAPWPALWIALGVAVLGAVAVATYARPRGRARPLDRGVMAGLRVTALCVLGVCLLRPSLVLTSVVPQRNFVAVLVDDSRSMTLPGEDGRPRDDFVKESFGPEGSPLLKGLSDRFAVRFFRFSSDASRTDDPAGLAFNGSRTDLATALDRVREELAGVPLSGVVVVSDGADNGGRALEEALVPLQAASVPVFTVGLGDEVLSPDLELGRVQAPSSVLQGTSLVVDVVVNHRGVRAASVPLEVEDDGRILASRDVQLGKDGEPVLARVQVTLDKPGERRLRFRVPVQDGERVIENNHRDVTVDVKADRDKILYVEGEPRFEVKFIRRAVEDDPNLQVVVLQRTAEHKFLRLDVDTPEELSAGFPTTREELFRYRALILGSMEASFFTHDQLAMIADFASQRGGGLLVLGGRKSFAEGGYAGTPLADALPVVLGKAAPDPAAAVTEVKVAPTLAGRDHPVTQIAPSDSLEAAWARLPALTTLNDVERLKPGATELLQGTTPAGGTRVVLASQRYGRGKVAALPVQDTWLWQMDASIPPEDQSHERFWRQLLRWLVDGVPEPVTASLPRERVEVGEPARIVARVTDSSYIEMNDARVTAAVISPSGDTARVPLDWSVDEDGLYSGTFTPTEAGDHQVAVGVQKDGNPFGADALTLRVGPGDEEYFDAGRRTRLLRRMADETGGRFYTASTVSTLPEDIQYAGSGVTLTEERDLWDMPIVFLLLVGLVGAEWGYRRKRGLV